MVVGSPSGIVTIHTLPDGMVTRRLQAHQSEVWAVAFSPSRALLATGARQDPDGVKLWNAETWEPLQVLRGHVGLVLDLAFSSDGTQLASCGFDRTLRVWGR